MAYSNSNQTFVTPERKIINAFDVGKWYKSEAYQKFMLFLHRINDAVIGIPTTSDVFISDTAKSLVEILEKLEGWISKFPPEDMGAQRFGNKAYKLWNSHLLSESESIMKNYLPPDLVGAVKEIVPYFLDSFGNSTRIDYGSGHELNFLIFIFCLSSIGVFSTQDDQAIVLRVFHRYLKLVKQLQIIYRMEPAGSRGVHAIDDFQFAPFIFGSSQLINNKKRLIPDYYLRRDMVEQYQNDNLFFEAIQYINETKTGLFHEHSNQLYNISAVQTWEQVNKGMFRMYEGEVLKKFPVIQHILFGTIFSFNECENPVAIEENSSINEIEKIARSQHPSKLGAIPE